MIKSKAFRVCALAFVGATASGGAALASCGTASWYHQGSVTANGERYRPDGVSAAHKTLPFGTKVLVRNQRTGRTVTVRINDRGPFIRGRIIDLSRGAKNVIGMGGLAPVCLTILGRGPRVGGPKANVQRVAQKSRKVAKKNRRVREVYGTTQTSARMAGKAKRTKQVSSNRRNSRAAKRANVRAAEQRQYRQRRALGAERQVRREQSSSFRLAGWPRTAYSN